MKKHSTLKFMTKIGFIPSVCIHRPIILIFIGGEGNMLVDFFPRKIYFSEIFDFHFRENPRFHDEFQDLHHGPKWGRTRILFPLPSRSKPRSTTVLGAGIAQLVVHGLAVHGVAGSILLWGHFPVEGIFPLELTWVQTPFPPKLLRMRV